MNKILVTAFGALALASASNAANASGFTIHHAFCAQTNCVDGAQPIGAPVADASGNYFGTTSLGGVKNSGTIYRMSYDGAHWHYKRIHSFCSKASCIDGDSPRSTLVIDASGNLYGTTYGGGAGDTGTVFRLSPNGAGWTFKVLHSFCHLASCADGSRPQTSALTYQGAASGAMYDGTSPLYGVTTFGGAHNSGAVYKLTPNATQTKWTAKTIYSFCSKASCTDGNLPYSGAIMDGSGNLFGATSIGGAFGHGVVYQLAFNGTRWIETVLYSFCSGGGFCADGDNPIAPLALSGDGSLIGTTYFGGAHAKGSVFKVVPNGTSSQLTTLYSFCAEAICSDGSNPNAGVAIDANGNLLGTTYQGGVNGKGIVYKLTGKNHDTMHILASMGTAPFDGGNLLSGVVLDPNGRIYGVAPVGGTNGKGIFYSLVP